MYFDPRMRGLGRWRYREGEKDKRDVQDIMATSREWDAATSVASDAFSIRTWLASGNSAEYNSASTGSASMSYSGKPPAQSQGSSSGFPSISPPELSSSDVSGSTTPKPVPTTKVTPLSSVSVGLGNTARGTSPVASMQPESTTAGNDSDDLQTPFTGSPSLNLHPSSTASNDLHAAVVSESSTASVTHNTWITATSVEALSSGVTIVPLITFGETSSTSSAIAIDSMTMNTLGSFSSDSPSSTIDFPSSTLSIASAASAPPQIAQMDGATSTGNAGTVVGVTAGAVVVLLLVLLSVIAYTRGGAMRGLSSNIHFPVFRASRRAPPVSQSQENFFRRRETAELRPRDLENATVTSGSHYDEQDGDWEEIDVREARSGNMEKDNGEWLESWRRGKERMVTIRRPPELQFNPALPLPPINWEGARRKT